MQSPSLGYGNSEDVPGGNGLLHEEHLEQRLHIGNTHRMSLVVVMMMMMSPKVKGIKAGTKQHVDIG